MNDIENILCFRYREIRELIIKLAVDENSGLSNNPSITTLKAALFLIFYNLIESVMYTIYEVLFDEISINCSRFSKLSPSVQQQYKKYDKKNCIAEDDLLALSLEDYLRKVTLFSGNLDARAIRTLLHDWGIEADFHVKEEERLRDIREYRNTLAHGERAFKEIGRNYTMRDMRKYSRTLYQYLNSLVQTIKPYIEEKRYMVG